MLPQLQLSLGNRMRHCFFPLKRSSRKVIMEWVFFFLFWKYLHFTRKLVSASSGLRVPPVYAFALPEDVAEDELAKRVPARQVAVLVGVADLVQLGTWINRKNIILENFRLILTWLLIRTYLLRMYAFWRPPFPSGIGTDPGRIDWRPRGLDIGRPTCKESSEVGLEDKREWNILIISFAKRFPLMPTFFLFDKERGTRLHKNQLFSK